MILVDTSVWVDHLREVEPGLVSLLQEDAVLTHPFVIEELACGHLARRAEILGHIGALPKAPLATHREVLDFIESERLDGAGVCAPDVHLLASARLARAKLWSKDRALSLVARRLGIQASGGAA